MYRPKHVGQVETEELESWNRKLKRKAERVGITCLRIHMEWCNNGQDLPASLSATKGLSVSCCGYPGRQQNAP